MSETLGQDADELLHWLNAHSVRVSDGVPAGFLQQRWRASGRDSSRLKATLEWLFKEKLVVLAPGLQPPHVRFSSLGFQRLIDAHDEFRNTPTLQAVEEALTHTPEITKAREPQPVKPQDSVPPPESRAPVRFLTAADAPTEIALRNQILHVFRDLRLKSGQQLIAMTLSRYWQEMGLRAGDLRIGLDVLIRDGYLKPQLHRYENYWQLTEDGYNFLSANPTPAALAACAPPMASLRKDLPPQPQLMQMVKNWVQSRPGAAIASLQSDWPLGLDSLIHGLDLCWKQGTIQMRANAGSLSFYAT